MRQQSEDQGARGGIRRRTLTGTLWRLKTAGRGLGVRAGLLPYRPIDAMDAEAWDAEYAEGRWDRIGQQVEMARYSVLLGYLAADGGEPELLDVGCGVGLLRERLDPLPFRRYLGVDVSAAAIERAMVLADERTEFAVVSEVSPALGAFDVVVCNEMLYYVERPEELLDSIRLVLRPGGSLLSSSWRHQGDEALHRMIDSRFTLVDRVELRNEASRRLRWRISWHRRSAE